MEEIDLGHKKVKIIRKNIKHMHLKIKRYSGEVQVVAPKSVDYSIIKDFVQSKEAWIITHTKGEEDLIFIRAVNLKEPGHIYIFGEKKSLKINYIDKNPIFIEETSRDVVINVKKTTKIERSQALVRDWYRGQLEDEIKVSLLKWQDIMDIKECKARTKRMKTRWGSCNPFRKNIWLNLELAKLPKKYLDYVVVHELVHFFERGHGENFQKRLELYYPNWREIKGEMDKMIIIQ